MKRIIHTFTSSFTDTSEYGVTTMSLGDVVDQFHNEDSLADSSTTEETNFTSLGVWGDQIDDLDTSFENFGGTDGIGKFRCVSVNGGVEIGVDWTTFIDGFTNNVDDTTECSWTDWNLDWGTGINDILATDKSLCGVHSNGSDLRKLIVSEDLEHNGII